MRCFLFSDFQVVDDLLACLDLVFVQGHCVKWQASVLSMVSNGNSMLSLGPVRAKRGRTQRGQSRDPGIPGLEP